jgi:hypothetical protein
MLIPQHDAAQAAAGCQVRQQRVGALNVGQQLEVPQLGQRGQHRLGPAALTPVAQEFRTAQLWVPPQQLHHAEAASTWLYGAPDFQLLQAGQHGAQPARGCTGLQGDAGFQAGQGRQLDAADVQRRQPRQLRQHSPRLGLDSHVPHLERAELLQRRQLCQRVAEAAPKANKVKLQAAQRRQAAQQAAPAAAAVRNRWGLHLLKHQVLQPGEGRQRCGRALCSSCRQYRRTAPGWSGPGAREGATARPAPTATSRP